MIMGERVVTRFHLYRSYAGFTYGGLPNISIITVVCALLSKDDFLACQPFGWDLFSRPLEAEIDILPGKSGRQQG